MLKTEIIFNDIYIVYIPVLETCSEAIFIRNKMHCNKDDVLLKIFESPPIPPNRLLIQTLKHSHKPLTQVLQTSCQRLYFS